MVDVLMNLFRYSSVALVGSSDDYGTGSARAFSDAASTEGLKLSVTMFFRKDAKSYDVDHLRLQRSKARVIVLFCQSTDGARFMRSALSANVGGAGFLWMIGDPFLSDVDLWSGHAEERVRALKGFFTLLASTGEGTARYDAYRARRAELPMMSDVQNGWCSPETSSEGTHLWQQDHDGDAQTATACANDDPQREAFFDSFGYDAVFAVAHAVHDLLHVQNRTRVDGDELRDALLHRVSFEGVTGRIAFRESSAEDSDFYVGDRLAGFSYGVWNWVDSNSDLVQVGSWTPCKGKGNASCDWSERWLPKPGVACTFSTADNSRPGQVADCTYGEFLSHDGICECDDGFQLVSSGQLCRRCDPGRYSLRASPNTSGSAGCTM
jgi:hypothetical protein